MREKNMQVIHKYRDHFRSICLHTTTMGVENPQLSCHLYLTRTLSMAIVPYHVISMALALLFMAGHNNSGCLLGTGGKCIWKKPPSHL